LFFLILFDLELLLCIGILLTRYLHRDVYRPTAIKRQQHSVNILCCIVYVPPAVQLWRHRWRNAEHTSARTPNPM